MFVSPVLRYLLTALVALTLLAVAALAEARPINVCVKHPKEGSTACVTGDAHVVEVCDTSTDNNQAFAKVQTEATKDQNPAYKELPDANGGQAGCSKEGYSSTVLRVAICSPGEGCSDWKNAFVPDPQPTPSPTPTPPTPPTPNGTPVSRDARIAVTFRSSQSSSIGVRYKTTPDIDGVLTDAAGTAISGATIGVYAQPRGPRQSATYIGSAATDGVGAFAYTIPPGPSRTFTFSYTAYNTDTTFAATAEAATRVRARVSARVTDRTPIVGQRVAIKGRLIREGVKGVQVNIQIKDRRGWRTVDSVKTSKGGRYRWRHRFRSISRGDSFRFRAMVSDAAAYPFHKGFSSPVRFRVF